MRAVDSTYVSADDIATALVSYGGNEHLAAEQLHISVSDLIATLSQDKAALASFREQIATYALLGSLKTLTLMQATCVSKLASLESNEAASSYIKLLDVIGRMCDTKEVTHNLNIYEGLQQVLPPHYRNALRELVTAGSIEEDKVEGEIDFD